MVETTRSNDSSDSESPVEEPPKTTLGSLCEVKKLWDGGADKYGYQLWLYEQPYEGEDLSNCKETQKYAISIRHCKTNTRNVQKLQDIVIRSAEMKELLEKCIPSLSDYFDQDEKGIVLAPPFQPLFFHWQKIENVLLDEHEGTFINKHAQLLYHTLKEVYDSRYGKWKEMTSAGDITFDLLWTLFLPGTDVVSFAGADKLISKVTQTTYRQDPFSGTCCTTHEEYIEWDGNNFGWASTSTNVKHFSGRRKITKLPVYPLKYYPDETQLIKEVADRGRVFARLTSSQPMIMSYNGSYDLDNDEGQSWFKAKRSVKVSERVMLDTLAYKHYRSSGPRISHGSMVPQEVVAKLDDPETESKNREFFMYCSSIVYGYGLRTKQWIKFGVLQVHEVKWDTEAWPNLVLAKDYKNLTYAFTKSQLEGGQDFDDFIIGKCQGMIMLLAGPPGTGKTFTTEGLAEEMRRPLYSISATELGNDAGTVERGLGLAFDLATRWNALILLDEADVFLEKRSDNHLERNAVVATFLRKLEYYSGIVFLTTNRASNFDPAFESRIHITVTFKNLDHGARQDVWTRFVKSAEGTADHGVEVSEQDVKELAKYPLNGREIRNMVKSALLLAWNEKQPLKMEHIQVVWRVKRGTPDEEE